LESKLKLSYSVKWRKLKDKIATGSLRSSLVFINCIALFILLVLFLKALPILEDNSVSMLLFSSDWHPGKGQFGFLPFIIGSITVTLIGMIIAVPVCLLSAIFLVEYMRRRMREFIRLLIDILAGIPSVIYGLFGVIVIVPIVSFVSELTGNPSTGYSLLAGGLVLAIMVVPFIISVTVEVLVTVPNEARECSLALGTTRWEMVRYVIVKHAKQGIVAAIILGFARAFGETIAVMMVVGNVAKIPKSIFDPAYPLPALIANNYGEMMSIPLYDSALLLAALILMLIVGVFSFGAHITLSKIGRNG
jgi:phosphate transport system permease protein